MDFTSTNFGDLLFALNCDLLKNEIRKIEKINKRIVQTENGIYFIYIYNYIYIYMNMQGKALHLNMFGEKVCHIELI